MSQAFAYLWNNIFYLWSTFLSGFNSNLTNYSFGSSISNTSFNIYLFSERGWFSNSINVHDILLVFLTVSTFIIIIKLLIKIIKLPLRFFR